MDYQAFADSVDRPCAIVSVEETREGACGEVRLVCANQDFIDVTPEARFFPGMRYQEHMPRNPKFEDFCFRAAILGEAGHVYVEHPKGWVDQQVIPLKPLRQGVGLCLFTFTLTEGAESRRLATVSVSITDFAIRASLTLMAAEDFKEGVRTVLRETLAVSGAHNSRVFLLDHRNRSYYIYCEAESSLGIRRENSRFSYALMQSWAACMGDRNALLLSTPADFDAVAAIAPAWAENLRENDVKSLVLLPLRREKEIFGYVDFVNFDTRTAAEVQELAELITVYLGAEISNHQLMSRLEHLSHTDPLTGLKNRHAMITRLDGLGDSPFGVINLDLNGLKSVNDAQGHEAGDRLLLLAAEALKKVFYFDDIYRTGGDEFIVLIPGIGEETFQRKLLRFRQAMDKNPEVSFAIGACWSDGSMGPSEAFRRADDAMYADKKAYYQRYPERRQR